MLSCDENVIFKSFVVVAKSVFDECFRFCELLLANHPLCAVMILPRREHQNDPKWQYYLGQTHMHIDPLPTTIIYIYIYIYIDIIIIQQQ